MNSYPNGPIVVTLNVWLSTVTDTSTANPVTASFTFTAVNCLTTPIALDASTPVPTSPEKILLSPSFSSKMMIFDQTFTFSDPDAATACSVASLQITCTDPAGAQFVHTLGSITDSSSTLCGDISYDSTGVASSLTIDPAGLSLDYKEY